MTKNEIIEMAIQAHYESKTWIDIYKDEITAGTVRGYLEAFAKLVAQHERERVMNEPINKAHWQRFEEEIRAKEREACAKVCEAYQDPFSGNAMADAIRAIGEA